MAALGLYDGLLPRGLPRFAFPALCPSSRALVLGMGGGCDVFAASALARLWATGAPEGARVAFATCIGARPLPPDHEPLAECLFRLPPEVVPLEPGDEAYGTTRLELSVPRGDDGSPLLFIVPKDGKSGIPLEDVTTTNSAAIGEALRTLGTTSVVAVDLGGDSLTGGVDFAGGNAEFGRDRQVLRALEASGVPFVHLVLGPGCDGESTVPQMQEAVRAADERGALLGVLPLADVVPPMAALARTLSPNRTPNILARALAAAEAGIGPAEAGEGLCTITRHGHTNSVPWSWLQVALALQGGA